MMVVAIELGEAVAVESGGLTMVELVIAMQSFGRSSRFFLCEDSMELQVPIVSDGSLLYT
jgi:hypothetical protein